MADEPDRHPDDIHDGQAHVHRLKLERIFAMPESPSEADRLRAVLPSCLKHALSLQDRIGALEGRPEVRDYFGAKILPGVLVAYVSTGSLRPKLAHGEVLGVEPCRRRLIRSVIQIHLKTHRGTHVRIFDPKRVIVLSGTITKETSQ